MTKLRFCLVAFCIATLTLAAMGQIQNGQFTGTVTDASGAALAGAKVTMTNSATNLSVSTTTNGTGVYYAKELPIGVYKITVEASGFRTFENAGVTLDAGTIARVDIKMQLGAAREDDKLFAEEMASFTEHPASYISSSSCQNEITTL